TYVELVFECRGERYKVRRSPEYEREGYKTKKPASVELLLPDGSLITNTKAAEVNDRIKSIVGVDHEQYTRIAMIAQGEFRDFLMKESKDKIAIMRKLFKTDNFMQMQEKLKDFRSSANREYEQCKTAILVPVKQVNCDEGSAFYQMFLELSAALDQKDVAAPADQFELLAGNIVAEDHGLLERLAREKEEKEEKKMKLQREIEVRKEATQAQNALQQAQEKIRDLDKENIVLQEKRKEALAKEPEINTLSERIPVEKQQLGDYDLLENLKDQTAKTEKRIAALEAEKISAEKKVNEKKEAIEKLASEKETLKGAGEDLAKQKAEKDKLAMLTEELPHLFEQAQRTIVARHEADTTADAYIAVRREADAARADYDAAHRCYMDNQAGILAKELMTREAETGREQPCPVCGSLQHPFPAKLPEKTVSSKELEKLKKLKDSLEKQESEKSRISGEKKTAFEEAAKHFDLLNNRLAEKLSVEKQIVNNQIVEKMSAGGQTAESGTTEDQNVKKRNVEDQTIKKMIVEKRFSYTEPDRIKAEK
ncbi:MAG: hypothetical protein II821_01185, partial [Treponema sp.]|nr:hypothetical protein [Treponema sp.]